MGPNRTSWTLATPGSFTGPFACACVVMRRSGDFLLFWQDRAAEVKAICETLKDILKYLVSSASPSVVLGTKPMDAREVQVSLLTRVGAPSPPGPWPAARSTCVCFRCSSGPSTRASWCQCLLVIHDQPLGKLRVRGTGFRSSRGARGVEGKGPLSIVPP